METIKMNQIQESVELGYIGQMVLWHRTEWRVIAVGRYIACVYNAEFQRQYAALDDLILLI
jgi:hypothetical protein